MEPKRGRRIRDKQRMKAKIARLIKVGALGYNPDTAHKVADNITVCSCQMCRNPRRSTWHSGDESLTMQERRFMSEGVII